MLDNHSSTPAPSSKSAKPTEHYPNFPLTATWNPPSQMRLGDD